MSGGGGGGGDWLIDWNDGTDAMEWNGMRWDDHSNHTHYIMVQHVPFTGLFWSGMSSGSITTLPPPPPPAVPVLGGALFGSFSAIASNRAVTL